MTVTQAEVDTLLRMAKYRANETVHNYPALGGRPELPLLGADGKETFILDVRRNRVNLRKGTYQNRARTNIILARLDFGGAPHRNPDGEEIPCPHLHVYREGYGDTWAYPLEPTFFTQQTDAWQLLHDFMQYVTIVRAPLIERGLFT